MSEYDDPATGRRQEDKEVAESRVEVAKWSPWIWIIPVLAIFFVGWLIVRYGFFGGGDITVRFAEARGLDRYSPVRFRGAKVGTVQKISIDSELKEVVVRISMDAAMSHALRSGTRFWIVEPGIEGGGLGGLLSGTYVGIAPGGGEETREFRGQEYAPVIAAPEAGKTVILEGQGVGSLALGSPVQFQGMRVGRILGSEYDAARGVTSVHAFVVQRFAGYIRESTRFYRAGGLSMSLGGGGVKMGDASLASLLNAPVEFYTPEVLAGAPVPQGSRFELHESRGAAIAASEGPHLTYLTYFPGPIQGLAPGTPVQMKGVQVGRVRDVRLRYIPSNASLETPVTLEIDARQLEFDPAHMTSRQELRVALDSALQRLVQRGMRARLATSLVLPGASAVSLDFVAAPGTGQLVMTSDPPIIPAAGGGSGIEGALGSISDVAATIRNLPLQEIATDMRRATQRMNALLHDPILEQSLRRLDTSLTEVERAATTARQNMDPIARSIRNAAESTEAAARTIESAATTASQNVEPIARSIRNAAESAEAAAKTIETTASTASQNIEPIAESLRNAAAAAEAAARRAEQLIGTSQRQGYDISELVRELTRAAEAVRALATYLTENPETLIRGRGEE